MWELKFRKLGSDSEVRKLRLFKEGKLEINKYNNNNEYND